MHRFKHRRQPSGILFYSSYCCLLCAPVSARSRSSVYNCIIATGCRMIVSSPFNLLLQWMNLTQRAALDQDNKYNSTFSGNEHIFLFPRCCRQRFPKQDRYWNFNFCVRAATLMHCVALDHDIVRIILYLDQMYGGSTQLLTGNLPVRCTFWLNFSVNYHTRWESVQYSHKYWCCQGGSRILVPTGSVISRSITSNLTEQEPDQVERRLS